MHGTAALKAGQGGGRAGGEGEGCTSWRCSVQGAPAQCAAGTASPGAAVSGRARICSPTNCYHHPRFQGLGSMPGKGRLHFTTLYVRATSELGCVGERLHFTSVGVPRKWRSRIWAHLVLYSVPRWVSQQRRKYDLPTALFSARSADVVLCGTETMPTVTTLPEKFGQNRVASEEGMKAICTATLT